MRYRELRDQHLPIGSGEAEAANKTLVGQRMERSGMRWGMVDCQAVLTFRAMQKSDRFDAAWDRLMAFIGKLANESKTHQNCAMAA